MLMNRTLGRLRLEVSSGVACCVEIEVLESALLQIALLESAATQSVRVRFTVMVAAAVAVASEPLNSSTRDWIAREYPGTSDAPPRRANSRSRPSAAAR